MKTNDSWKDLLANKFGDALQEAAAQEPIAEVSEVASPKKKCRLRVELDKHGRKGKPVTLVTEFQGDEKELARLTKLLQTRIGAGGSHCFNSEDPYDGQILIQGDCRSKVGDLLEKEGYRVTIKGL